VSLLVSYCHNGEETCTVVHVDRFDFVAGNLISRKRVLTVNVDTDGHPNRIINSRCLLLAPQGKLYDLNARRYLSPAPTPLAGSETPKLPGLLSPDGRKSVYLPRLGSNDSLEIRSVGKPTVVVKNSFDVTVRAISAVTAILPVAWVDNQRILTQRSNGHLVIVAIDGRVSPLLELPCTNDGGPSLRKYGSSKIVYSCDGNRYLVDVDNRRFEPTKEDLGNGFSVDFRDGTEVYYHQNQEIGRIGFYPLTTKSYLAVRHGDAVGGVLDTATIKTIKVWNETRREWIVLTIDGWAAEIVGWIG